MKDILIGGVDEAGRGSIIGPLVIAGVSMRTSNIQRLRILGVRDSKLLSRKSRGNLFGHIAELAESICIFVLNCREIDENVAVNRLNILEADGMAQVISTITADKTYVDACDVNPGRYKSYIASRLGHDSPELCVFNHADSLHVVVSAASIIAKVFRDNEISEINKHHNNNIGSGYPCDRKTMNFLKNWVTRFGSAPQFARKSWKPLRIMLEELTSCELTHLPL